MIRLPAEGQRRPVCFCPLGNLGGDNPGLVQPDMIAKIGLAKDKRQALNEYNARWLRSCPLLTAMQRKKGYWQCRSHNYTYFCQQHATGGKGEPLISLAGEDALNLIQEKLAKIRAIQLEIQQLYNQFSALEITAPMDGIVAYIDAMPGRTVQPGTGLAIFILLKI